MDLILDEDDVRRLNNAAHALLSPSDHPALHSWVEASVRAATRFLKADRSVMVLPTGDRTVLWSENIPQASLPAVREAITGADPHGASMTENAGAGGAVFRRRVPAHHGVEPYVGLRMRVRGGRATLAWGYAGPDPFAPADSFAAVRLLLPAFRTGVRAALDLDNARQAARDASLALPGVREVMAVHDLTRREAEVALLLARGASNRDAAETLSVSPHTVRKHAEHIFAKLGIHSRTVLALLLALGAGAG
ncbi:MAG: LuxR C-terminal-related transcriptional regulator [Gemmatimonadota bacterium]|jgi:DNA-binding CsgD family transcriptional regulator